MPDIALTINGRIYKVACAPGEEEHLRALASRLDERVGQLVRSFGQVGEGQLLVAANLIMADELHEATAELARLRAAADGRDQELERRHADVIEGLAERIESIAAGLGTH